jgi:hypothetical protein
MSFYNLVTEETVVALARLRESLKTVDLPEKEYKVIGEELQKIQQDLMDYVAIARARERVSKRPRTCRVGHTTV